MRLVLMFSFIFASVIANASATDGVFGLAAGTYSGTGVLISKGMVPNLSFVSIRTLQSGVISAKTSAKLWGMPVAQAHANLKIVPVDSVNFEIVDVDTNQKCGKGLCSGQTCTFAASVMNGSLKLKETWVPTDSGFKLVNGWQNFKGLESTYSGSFTLSR